MEFVWDPAKAASNLSKHGVRFEDATGVFQDFMAASFFDAAHSQFEDRYVTVGMDSLGRLLYVVHTDANVVRIISARLASSAERNEHERNA
jgi:uncharacterized protein